ncbi:MAG TPA: hypothetical protein VF543_19390 [Pyrinomonadaceae bacterium]|jgi:hypothetical protein
MNITRFIYGACSFLFLILKYTVLLIHLWTIVIAYNWSGLGVAVLTGFLPIVAEGYWAIRLAFIAGTIINPYTLTIITFIVVFVANSFLRTAMRLRIEESRFGGISLPRF